MIYKVFGALIIIAAGVLAFLILQDEPAIQIVTKGKKAAVEKACVQLTPAEQLAKMINDDFQALAEAGQLPAQWNSIATVEVRMNSQLARTILGKSRPNFQRVKDGKNFLELEFMDMPDEENPGVIIQASLFDIRSRNKIFEIGRTYTMNQLNRIDPPPEVEPVAQATPEASAQGTPAVQQPQPAQQAPAANPTTAPSASASPATPTATGTASAQGVPANK